ncbi:histone-arginine methyltransferase METTL23-like [Ylistrum balloti]|uniref:histone-arginine methyltransferase METTL23-like n=1 Tax=Ylistrum balloti TaxID=509963 RepID=UPI002905A336|nr:histone-arginine methyltransferase METTL23-like [Ylistrum balloti]
MSCGQHPASRKIFTFSETSSDERITIWIPEVLDPSYGMYTWPCAPVLAQYVWTKRELIQGASVLEIGSGTALPGIIAAKCGANVILSDSANQPRCLDNCRASCMANGLSDVPVIGLTWGLFEQSLLDLPKVDFILGSDCFYDTKDFEDVLVTVAFLLNKNKKAEFWSTYQQRSSDRSIEFLLKKWRLTCTHVSLAMFGANVPQLAGSDLTGNHTIQMLVIKSHIQETDD